MCTAHFVRKIHLQVNQRKLYTKYLIDCHLIAPVWIVAHADTKQSKLNGGKRVAFLNLFEDLANDVTSLPSFMHIFL